MGERPRVLRVSQREAERQRAGRYCRQTFGVLLHLLGRASQATWSVSVPQPRGTWLLAAKGLR